MPARIFRARSIVGGDEEGEALVVNAISFYGEVDPATGSLADGRNLSGKILVMKRPRGSTVGAYVLYSLKSNNRHPKAIVTLRSDPVLISGAVIAGIPLYDRVDEGIFDVVKDGLLVKVNKAGEIIILDTT